MIYTVECGDYSDYHIKGFFSTRERALQFIARFNELEKNGWNGPLTDKNIVEHVLDEHTPPDIGGWTVTISDEGSVVYSDWDLDHNPHEKATMDQSVNKGRYMGVANFVGFGVTEEHARRSAEDLRREYIATHGSAKYDKPWTSE